MSAAASDGPLDQSDNRDLLKVVTAAIAFFVALHELLEPDPKPTAAAPDDGPRSTLSPRLQRIDIDGPE